MKIIDLLNKIADGEEVPKKIKYSSYIFKYTGDKRIQRLYVMENQDNYLLRDFVATLDSEVEIIEENKIPEKLEILNANEHSKERYYENYSKEEIVLDIETLQIWVNEIINYLEEKK